MKAQVAFPDSSVQPIFSTLREKNQKNQKSGGQNDAARPKEFGGGKMPAHGPL